MLIFPRSLFTLPSHTNVGSLDEIGEEMVISILELSAPREPRHKIVVQASITTD